MNEIDIERMYELEQMVNDDNIIYPLTLEEFYYVERASKIPYLEARKDMHFFGGIGLPLNQIRYIYYLLAKYNCTEQELDQRFKDVYSIKKYKNMLNTNLLKEQKRMIKRMDSR